MLLQAAHCGPSWESGRFIWSRNYQQFMKHKVYHSVHKGSPLDCTLTPVIPGHTVAHVWLAQELSALIPKLQSLHSRLSRVTGISWVHKMSSVSQSYHSIECFWRCNPHPRLRFIIVVIGKTTFVGCSRPKKITVGFHPVFTSLDFATFYGTRRFKKTLSDCIRFSLLWISQHFMEPEGSLSRSQEPSTGPYPEPDRSNPYHPTLSL
jgi:hypothetical protein